MMNLNDYYSGGYFLLRADKPDWPQLQTDLLPQKLISLSGHICPRLKVYWDGVEALRFGFPENKLDDFLAWCKSGNENDLDFPSMFYSTKAARRFIRQFDLNTTDLYLIGAGLPREVEEENWRAETEGRIEGVEKQIEQHLTLETGGTLFGFDVTSYAHHDFECSWFCNYLHQDIFSLYSIRPNQYGLLETYDEAKTIYTWINEPVVNRTRAESQLYDFWLLTSYSLEA